MTHIHTFKWDMLKLFCWNIHLEKSLCCHIVQGCFILVQNNTPNSARAGKATHYFGLICFSRNFDDIAIEQSWIDGSIFGKSEVLGADHMSFIFNHSCVLEIFGINNIMEIDVEGRDVYYFSIVPAVVLVPFCSLLDAPENQSEKQD